MQGEGLGCTTVTGNEAFAGGGWRSSELESGGLAALGVGFLGKKERRGRGAYKGADGEPFGARNHRY